MKPSDLPQTTAERLRAVADVIEAEEAWDQGTWVSPSILELKELLDEGAKFEYRGFDNVYVQQGRNDPACGTKCCIAGWAVRFTPRHTMLPVDWVLAGARALGVDQELAEVMFSPFFAVDQPGSDVAHLLRLLAELPEELRTYETVTSWAAQGDRIIAGLFAD